MSSTFHPILTIYITIVAPTIYNEIITNKYYFLTLNQLFICNENIESELYAGHLPLSKKK